MEYNVKVQIDKTFKAGDALYDQSSIAGRATAVVNGVKINNITIFKSGQAQLPTMKLKDRVVNGVNKVGARIPYVTLESQEAQGKVLDMVQAAYIEATKS